jgi:ankyrin repeat protein
VGDLEKVKTLLKDKPNLVFSKDDDGGTALNWAAANGYKAVAELLLANKFDSTCPCSCPIFFFARKREPRTANNEAQTT